jgi:hypothetical protein
MNNAYIEHRKAVIKQGKMRGGIGLWFILLQIALLFVAFCK